MKTKSDPKPFAASRMLILRSFLCAAFAFVTFNALSSTNTLQATLKAESVQVNLKVRFVQLQPDSDWWEKLDWFMLAGITNQGPTCTVNITRSQLQNVLDKLEQRDGANLVNEGQVTILSGRQANFQVPELQAAADGIAATQNAAVSTYEETLDLTPTVSDDGSTIEMVLIPTFTEFLETNQGFMPSTHTPGNAPVADPFPLLHSRVRQITLSSSVKDGQTLVFGDVWGTKQPLSPFGHVNPGVPGKSLLIFVTPTLVDPFGHRIHSADYYDSPPFGGFGRGGGGFRGGGN